MKRDFFIVGVGEFGYGGGIFLIFLERWNSPIPRQDRTMRKAMDHLHQTVMTFAESGVVNASYFVTTSCPNSKF